MGERAKSAEEYVEMVRQAMFEVQDLRECLLDDLEEKGRFPAFLDPLEQGVRELYRCMEEGSYLYSREDLPFMSLVRRHAQEIPFAELLEQINETHRRGMDLGDG